MKNYKSFVIFALCGLLVSIIMNTFFLEEKYQASTEILVNESLEIEKAGENINLAWIETYKEVIFSDKILNAVLSETKLNYTKDNLKENIMIETDGNSLLFTLQLLADSPKDAKKLNQSLVNQFSKEIESLQNVEDVKVLKKTKITNDPIYPKTGLNLFLGVLYGILIAVVFNVVKLVVRNKKIKMKFLCRK